MFNELVCNTLEVIFGLWLICVFIEFFFDIDIPELIKTIITKIISKRDKT